MTTNTIADTLNINQIDSAISQAPHRWLLCLDHQVGSTNWVFNFQPENGTGLARSERTGQLYAFKLSGRTVQQGMVRCAIYALEDISLAEGTVKADRTRRIGGAVNAIFLQDTDYVDEVLCG